MKLSISKIWPLFFSLSNEGDNEVSLKEEIEVIKVYLQIQKTRFEEKLEVDIDIESDALKIQILGKIIKNTLIIKVKNSGSLSKPKDIDCSGTGLKNVQRRLSHIFPDRSSFELSEEPQYVNAVIKIKLNTEFNE